MSNRTHPASTTRHRRRRRMVVTAVALTAVGAALLAPRPAAAGSYLVRQCAHDATGAQASWERTSDNYRSRARCGSGQGLQVHNLGRRTGHGRYGAWVWRAPAGTVFTSLRANASLLHHAGHRAQLLAVSTGGRAISFGRRHAAFRSHRRTGEFGRFEARLRCSRSAGCGLAGPERARAQVKGVALRVADRTSPRVSVDGGTLLGARVVRGTRSLGFTATDRGGGVRRMWVEANGVRHAAITQGCQLAGRFASRLVPCPRRATETPAIATAERGFVTGPNAVAVCAEDLALGGRPNAGCERRRVWVDNACPASAPDGVGARLDAGFGPGRARIGVRSDRSAILTGRLTDGAGHPVSGATICTLARVKVPGAPVRVIATARTGPDGRYAIELRRGPSRAVFVHHVRSGEVIARHGLAVRSRTRPTLAVRARRRARTGDRVRFRGRLPGPACHRRLVEIEARVGKRRWQVFRTARTNRRCVYTASYRLRATTRPTRHRFRARVRRQPGYPFLPGRSAVRSKRLG